MVHHEDHLSNSLIRPISISDLFQKRKEKVNFISLRGKGEYGNMTADILQKVKSELSLFPFDPTQPNEKVH